MSEAGTEGESAAATEAALLQAQRDQREAMLVSQNSLRDSRKQLLEVRETLQRQAEDLHSNLQCFLVELPLHVCCFDWLLLLLQLTKVGLSKLP